MIRSKMLAQGQCIVKNRRGGGKNETYALQTNLDRNLWVHVDELRKKKKWSA